MANEMIAVQPWHKLAGKITTDVLTAPKTCCDPDSLGEWPGIDLKIVTYLENHVVGWPWADHLALATIILAARRRQVNTIQSKLERISPRLPALFTAMGYESMKDWDSDEVFRDYLQRRLLFSDSDSTRVEFARAYMTLAKNVQQWLSSLPAPQQKFYRQWMLPLPEHGIELELKSLRSVVEQGTQKKRKAATGAIVPSLPAIRAMAQVRFNRLVRVRQAYHDALQALQQSQPFRLPLAFSYDEGDPPQERLYFRIWDRRTFVLAHKAQYSASVLHRVKQNTRAYSDDNNQLFLEFVRSERLVGDGPPEGWWFADLLSRYLLGDGSRRGTPDEIREKQKYLRAWGYGDDEKPEVLVEPFACNMAGLLSWPQSDGNFMHEAQSRAEGVLIPTESLHDAAMFGLLALDLFTTTGMRMNEVMQIRLDSDCVKRVTQPAPPGAKDQRPRERVCLMLVPKGERRNEPHPYYIGTEQLRLMQMVLQRLREHYGETDTLPKIAFDHSNPRAFRFQSEHPYLFQYNGRHMSSIAINGCLRFLLHGMMFNTQEGERVVVTAHLLRHAFATHAVQVLEIPRDVVREWLQQKDIAVTDYYSQPTDLMVAEHHDQLLMRVAAHINLGKRVLRAPGEQVQLYNEARNKVGTLADVEGGHCVSHGFCAAKFACIGCAGKVVDPAKRYQVERKREWAILQIDFCRTEGLLPEVNRLEQLIRDCDAELAEMDMMEDYRRDAHRVAYIQIGDGPGTAPVAPGESLRAKTSEDYQASSPSDR